MASDTLLNLLGAAFILIAAAIPGYLTIRLHGRIRLLTLALTIFCIVHSMYHFALASGLEDLGNNVFEPASVVLLIIFGGIYVSHVRTKRQETSAN